MYTFCVLFYESVYVNNGNMFCIHHGVYIAWEALCGSRKEKIVCNGPQQGCTSSVGDFDLLYVASVVAETIVP